MRTSRKRHPLRVNCVLILGVGTAIGTLGPGAFSAGVMEGGKTDLSSEALTMRRPGPFAAGLMFAAVHFVLSLGIVPLTLKIGSLVPAGTADSLFYKMLALVTRVLYFPILSLALYPRHWFPGNWITLPIALNSLLWGTGLALLLAVGRRMGSRPPT